MQLVKLVKVIHVIQLPYVMKRVEEFLGWSNAKLVLLFASAYALLHFSACVFFLTSNSYDNRDEDTWISSAVGVTPPSPPSTFVVLPVRLNGCRYVGNNEQVDAYGHNCFPYRNILSGCVGYLRL
jgi:hypothetical protein